MKHPRVVAHLEEVVELHQSVQLVGMSVVHVLRAQVQDKQQVQRDDRYNWDWRLHQQPGVNDTLWKTRTISAILFVICIIYYGGIFRFFIVQKRQKLRMFNNFIFFYK